MGLNYKWYNQRHKIKRVKKLPIGIWMKVADAAKYYKVTNQTIRHWYLQNRLKTVDFRNLIHVKIDDDITPSETRQKKIKIIRNRI